MNLWFFSCFHWKHEKNILWEPKTHFQKFVEIRRKSMVKPIYFWFFVGFRRFSTQGFAANCALAPLNLKTNFFLVKPFIWKGMMHHHNIFYYSLFVLHCLSTFPWLPHLERQRQKAFETRPQATNKWFDVFIEKWLLGQTWTKPSITCSCLKQSECHLAHSNAGFPSDTSRHSPYQRQPKDQSPSSIHEVAGEGSCGHGP